MESRGMRHGGCDTPPTLPLVPLAFEYLPLTQVYTFFWWRMYDPRIILNESINYRQPVRGHRKVRPPRNYDPSFYMTMMTYESSSPGSKGRS